MKIFISWSGELSQQLGNAFKEWIPDVLQTVHPYFTPEDIQKGERWSSEIAGELEASTFGIFCVTRENLSSGWMNFEAGAISKNKDKSQVCPILFGITPTDVVGPLQQFQATVFSKDEIYKLMKSINAKNKDNPLSEERLVRQFNLVWPDLENNINNILKSQDIIPSDTPIRNDRELLEEILSLVREIKKVKDCDNEKQVFNKGKAFSEKLIITNYINLIKNIERGGMTVSDVLKELQKMRSIFLDIIPFLQIPHQNKIELKCTLQELSFICPNKWDTPF